MFQDLIAGVTESLMPSGGGGGDKGMTCGTCDGVERTGAITLNQRAAGLIIKNSKTIAIKINRTIIMSRKFANKNKVFDDVGGY